MRARTYKAVSAVLALAMTTTMLVGCDKGLSNNEKLQSEKKRAENEQNVKDMSAILESKIDDVSNTDKDESVFVEMNSQGKILKTTVSDTLKNSGKNSIKDESELDDIVNLTGDEKFARDDEGKIIWENKGEDIRYQGTTQKDVPVAIEINYYLDNKLTDPEAMAGKSGHVDIEYKYVNTTKGNDYVPFVVLTGMAFDREKFKNVKINHGKVVTYNDSHLVLGFAIPGFIDELKRRVDQKTDALDKLDIPDSITVSADVEDFETSMAMTYVTSGLIDKDLSGRIDLSDITDKMRQLQDGADRLSDGARQLSDGTHKLKSGVDDLSKGTGKLADGNKTLFTGSDKLLSKYSVFNKSLLEALDKSAKGTKKLYDGVKPLKKGAKDLDDGAKQLDKGAKKIKDGSQKLDEATGKVKDGTASLKSGTGAIANGSKTLKEGLSTLKSGFDGDKKTTGLKDGAKAVKNGMSASNEGVKELVNTLNQTPKSLGDNIDAIVSKVSASSGGAIASKEALNATVEGINSAVKSGIELSAVLQNKGLDTATYYSLLEAYYSIKTLESVKTNMENSIAAKKDDIEKLLAGMQQLVTASDQISDGINKASKGVEDLYVGSVTLNKGANDLDSGAGQLKDGTTQLKDGTKSLSAGTKKLKDSSDKLVSGIKILKDGAVLMDDKIGDASPKIKSGIQQLRDGAKTLKDGSTKIDEGVATLDDGATKLDSGSNDIKEGVDTINEKGISQITDIVGDNVPKALEEIEDILNNGRNYDNFSGITKGMSGEVKFIYKTQEIKK